MNTVCIPYHPPTHRVAITGNPLKDNRLLKIMKGLEEGNKPLKELLNYLKKQPKAKQGGSGGAGGG